MARKERNEIPAEVAARVLFLSDRTCCVCREQRKPIQIHHLDEDPSNSAEQNLAVMCFDCHHDTQIRGGFGRQLNAHQILLYRQDWHEIVDRRRHGAEALTAPPLYGGSSVPGIVEVSLQKKPVHLNYLQLTEKDEENRYFFTADYPQLSPEDSTAATETNVAITAFVTRELQLFRAHALATSESKAEMDRRPAPHPLCWDDLRISHSVAAFADDLLGLELRLFGYWAGAAHPNHRTQTFNFLFQHSLQLELADLFQPGSNYLDALSQYCVSDLHAHQTPVLKSQRTGETDAWILKGAGPQDCNFEKFLLVKGGLRIFFDPYWVSSYAEGRREVFMPLSELRDVLKDPIGKLLS